MQFKKKIILFAAIFFSVLGAASSLSSCDDGRSYAELLEDENKSVNRFLVNQRVINKIPDDTIFEVGANAPYYLIDGDRNLYMQVLALGDGPMAKEDQQIYFRFMRYNLSYYDNTLDGMLGEGNLDDMSNEATSFRYQNFNLPSSSQYGSGIQAPLALVPLNSEINLVVKSQLGWTNEISYVIPYLYHIRYYKRMI